MSKINKKLIGTGILTALASSLCCILPILALIVGSSSIASSLPWLEAARPYFIIVTALILATVWYQQLKKPQKSDINCQCKIDTKKSFFQSKKFLLIITIFAITMTTFPYYSQHLFFKQDNQETEISPTFTSTIDIMISGMTCSGCEATIDYYVKKLPGVVNVESNYKTGKATIKYDSSKSKFSDIISAINNIGYKVK